MFKHKYTSVEVPEVNQNGTTQLVQTENQSSQKYKLNEMQASQNLTI
jgi:hypothetical protein